MPLFDESATKRVVYRFSQKEEGILPDQLDDEDLERVRTITAALLAGNSHEIFSFEHAKRYVEERIKPHLFGMPDYLKGTLRVDPLASPYALERFVAARLIEDPIGPMEEVQARKLAANARTLFSRCYQMLSKGE